MIGEGRWWNRERQDHGFGSFGDLVVDRGYDDSGSAFASGNGDKSGQFLVIDAIGCGATDAVSHEQACDWSALTF